jgi:hypothetical protein
VELFFNFEAKTKLVTISCNDVLWNYAAPPRYCFPKHAAIPQGNGHTAPSQHAASLGMLRVSTEVTFWHSAVYGSDFRRNSGEIPRNSAEFRGIPPELRRNHYRSPKIPRNSVSAEFRGHPRHAAPPGQCGYSAPSGHDAALLPRAYCFPRRHAALPG